MSPRRAPGAVEAFLRGRAPGSRNGRPEEDALRARNEEVAASIGARFLRPAVDRPLELAARRAAAEAAPGAIEETLAARGLLPEGLRSPRAFGVGRVGGGISEDALAQADRDAALALPTLAARWAAVSAGLALLGEADVRCAPWAWHAHSLRVLAAPRREIARELDNSMSYLTSALMDVLGDPNAFTSSWAFWRRWGAAPASVRAPEEARHSLQPRAYIDAHVRWQSYAAAGARIGFEGERWLAHRLHASEWRADTFADYADPFEPLVDVLRLGLAPTTLASTFLLLVPEDE